MNTTLFVGNVSFDATEGELRNLFAQHGPVKEATIVLDRVTRKPRGFAFVTMETPEGAQAAIQGLNGTELHGRQLAVNEARPREERPARFPRREGGGGPGRR